MSDPLAPPPRRPAPPELRDTIARRLQRTTSARRRARLVLVPLAAAATVAAIVLGASLLDRRAILEPVQTASPYPTSVSPTPTPPPRTAAPTPTPSVATELDVRPMTRAEIAADTESCRRYDKSDTDLPLGTDVRVRYAMVQRPAGVEGVGSPPVRRLVLRDSIGTWWCEDGSHGGWNRGGYATPDGSSSLVVDSGSSTSSCDGDSSVIYTSLVVAVADQAVVGRLRINIGATAGVWQTTRPDRGLLYLPSVLRGPEASASEVSVEWEVLDERGRRLAGQGQELTTRGTSTYPVRTCAGRPDLEPERDERPSDDAAGVRTCLTLARQKAVEADRPFSDRWRSRLVISTPERWGTVLSDGRSLVGCSLYPTRELSPFGPDTADLAKSSFYFALNPIVDTGESLWAAGRVPRDVTGISYRLPGKRDVAAEIGADGYWMVMYADEQAYLDEGDVADWDPVVVTVVGGTGTRRHSIPFSVDIMCRQVSHGC